MKKRKKLLFTILIFTASLFLNVGIQSANADFVPPDVEIAVINEYNSSFEKVFTMQPTPLSITKVLNFVENSTDIQPKQLLKYVYPSYNDAQLNSVTANLEQSNKYLISQGYKTKIIDSVLDTCYLKEEFSNNRPVIAFLNANGNYWIEQETAVVIYGYQKITYAGSSPNIIYFYSSVNHGSGAIFSGQENNIPLLQNESQIDPSANVTFKWVSTLYGFNK